MAIIEKEAQSMTKTDDTPNQTVPEYRVFPDIHRQINRNAKVIDIEVSLPGVKKENIVLKAMPEWFHLEGRRGTMVYSANKAWGEEVEPEKTTAKYEEGLLSIHAVIKDPMEHAREISL